MRRTTLFGHDMTKQASEVDTNRTIVINVTDTNLINW
jgi:hypothetical protein